MPVPSRSPQMQCHLEQLRCHFRLDCVQVGQSSATYRSTTKSKNNVPFFAFTLVREPVAFHDSNFNFFHHIGCQYAWCEPNLYENMTEPELLASMTSNQQCEILYHGQLEVKHNVTARPVVTETECQRVMDVLRDDWDDVGTTETVATVTLPMLFRLLKNDVVGPKDIPNYTSRLKVVATEQTKATIRSRSWLDERWYALYK